MLTRSLYLLSFLSGFAALVYQVAWTRMLSLTFGSAILAASAVVAGFMGGMGIGAWLYHRGERRIGNALKAYAVIEFGIVLTTAAVTLLLQPLPQVFAQLVVEVPQGVSSDALRIVAVIALLLVPSALMGATYPAVCSAVIHTREEVARHLGSLYGLNTLGAALGALVTGLVMIEQLGLRYSVDFANAINLGVSLTAAWLARSRSVAVRRAVPAPLDEALPTSLSYWLTGVVIVGSGFATLGYEIVWFRALRYIVGNSTYALTNILVVFLMGLGLGALLLRPVLRRGLPERSLALTQLGIAVLSLLVILAEQLVLSQPALHDELSVFSPIFQAQPWWHRLLVTSALSLAVMLPATLLMGLSFPLASRLYLGSIRLLGRRIGRAYLLANLGSILGSILAAVVILPSLGTVNGTRLLAGVNLSLGLVLLFRISERRQALMIAAVFLLMVGGISWRLPERLTFQGDALSLALLPQLIFEEEGELATVQVRVNPGKPDHRGMLIDGTIIAASSNWLPAVSRKQALLAHLPLAVDRSIKKTLNVGLASASTLNSLASYPEIEVLDAVEINAAVRRAAAYFDESAVLADPRVDVAIEDAVYYLLRSPKTYDLIISDGKQNEDFSGNAKLLSREFYEVALDKLGECGIFIQWIALETHPRNFEIILRTFFAVFPEMEVFVDLPSSIHMLGSRCPIAGREVMSRSEFDRLSARPRLQALGIAGPDSLRARWIASGSRLREMLPPGPINHSDRLVLEFITYRATPRSYQRGAPNLRLLVDAGTDETSAARRAFAPPASESAEIMRALNQAFLEELEGDGPAAIRRVREVLKAFPDDPSAKSALKWLKMSQRLPAQ